MGRSGLHRRQAQPQPVDEQSSGRRRSGSLPGMTQDWARLRAQATEQSQLLTRRQCLAAGLSRDLIAHRLATGRWRRLYPGVYLTTPGKDDWFMRATAALLHAGDGAALCGESAAYLWALRKDPPRHVDIAIPLARRLTARDGIRFSRRQGIETLADEMTFPWRTTIPVTVLDLAAAGGPDAALAAVARPVQQARVTVEQLRGELERRGRHPHGRLLREVLDDVEAGAESAAEVRYVRDVERAHGLPTGERQAATHHGTTRRHDNRYSAYRLVVEVDGRLGHESWQDRVRDGRRDRQILPSEGTTLRVFWPDVAVTPCTTALEIGAALTSGGWTGRPHRCRRSDCVLSHG